MRSSVRDCSCPHTVAFLIADRAKLMEEIEVIKKLKFANGVNGMSKESELLSEIIKVSSEKEVLRREVSELCDRVQLLEKASRQLEVDNERLAYKLSEALAELEERESQLKHLEHGYRKGPMDRVGESLKRCADQSSFTVMISHAQAFQDQSSTVVQEIMKSASHQYSDEDPVICQPFKSSDREQGTLVTETEKMNTSCRNFVNNEGKVMFMKGSNSGESSLTLLWPGFRGDGSPRPSCRRSLSLQRADSPRNSFHVKLNSFCANLFQLCGSELSKAVSAEGSTVQESGMQIEVLGDQDNKDLELHKSLSLDQRSHSYGAPTVTGKSHLACNITMFYKDLELHKSLSLDQRSHSYGADSTPPSLLLSEFSTTSPKKLASLLDSQIAASRTELVRLEEIKKLQCECENLKSQLVTVTEKYNALAMRHIQYKAKRRAQVDELRSRLDAEMSSLQCQVDSLQSQLGVQRKMLIAEESFRERVEADYRQLQEEKRGLMVSLLQLESRVREKERELSVLGRKIILLENNNSDLLAKVLQLKYTSSRHPVKNLVPKSNSVEGILTDLGTV
uniref:Uncharacterized protein n=1 Tax=Timema douglasi TaxID=61478 RepID=A0A7R8Z7U5_TIMDO|nr:unnamed protein product [Timema douglasi]